MRTFFNPLATLAVVTAVALLAPSGLAQEAGEALLRGPIHEGFAEPISANPQPTLIAPRRPPEPIEEVAPDVRPNDETTIWLPGYWSWDQERDGFIWVSGTWRVPPPDRRWLPGYWVEVSGGYQWVPGFWASLETEQISYLPTPPESPEIRPNTEAPGNDYIWVNGCWLYQDGRFVWRPGYWHRTDPEWVWVSAHYSWTPNGVIFVNGYWDYPLGSRGFVYAPVFFRQVAGVRYTPNVWVDVGNIAIHLFVNPRTSHYFFGDYYGDRYARDGYYPWYSFHTQRQYDPLLGYYAARYRQNNIDYVDRLRGWNQYYATHQDLRPPRTLVDQRQFITRIENRTDVNVTNINKTVINSSIVARPVQEAFDRNPRLKERSQRVSQEQLQTMARESKDLRGLVQQRQRVEAGATAAGPRQTALRLPKPSEDLTRRVTARRMPLPDTPERGDGRGGRDATGGRDLPGRDPGRDLPGRPGDRPGLPGTGLPDRGGPGAAGPRDIAPPSRDLPGREPGRDLPGRPGDRPGLPGTGLPDRGGPGAAGPRDIAPPSRDLPRPGLPGAGRDVPRPGLGRDTDATPGLPGRGPARDIPDRGRETGPSDPRGGPGLAPDARVPSRPDIRTPGGPGLRPGDANRPGPGGAPDPRPPAGNLQGRDRREAGPGPGRGAGPGLAPDARVPSRPDIRTPGGPGLRPEDANRPGPGGAPIGRDRPPREVGPGDPRGGPSLAPDARVPSRADMRTPGGPGLKPDDANRPGPGGARGSGRERSADRDDRGAGGPNPRAIGPPAATRPTIDKPPAAGRLPSPGGGVTPGPSRPEPRKIDRPAVSAPSPAGAPGGGRPDVKKPDKPDKQPGPKKDKDKEDDERKGGKGR